MDEVGQTPVAKDTKGKETIADRIHHAMRLRGLGYNEMDRLLGKSEGYTSRLVSEQRTPRADTVRTIAEKLVVSAYWLLEGKGTPQQREYTQAETEKLERMSESLAPYGKPPKDLPPPMLDTSRYMNLGIALSFFGNDHWSPEAVAAANAMRLDADQDPSPQWWAAQLDRIDAAIQDAKMVVGEPLEGDPIADAKGSRGSRKTGR